MAEEAEGAPSRTADEEGGGMSLASAVDGGDEGAAAMQ